MDFRNLLTRARHMHCKRTCLWLQLLAFLAARVACPTKMWFSTW